MAARSTIIGLEKLDAVLKAKAALLGAAAALSVAAEVKAVAADAVREAPERDGDLKAGINGSSRGTSGEVRSTARHSPFQEFGTSRHGAQPFMGPAAARSRVRFVGRVRTGVRKAVD